MGKKRRINSGGKAELQRAMNDRLRQRRDKRFRTLEENKSKKISVGVMLHATLHEVKAPMSGHT